MFVKIVQMYMYQYIHNVFAWFVLNLTLSCNNSPGLYIFHKASVGAPSSGLIHPIHPACPVAFAYEGKHLNCI